MEMLYLGIEIGATKQQLAVGNAEGHLLETIQEKIPLPRGAADILDWLRAKIPPLLAAHKGRIRALSAGFGGPIQSDSGLIIESCQVPGWENFALRKWLEDTFHLPAIVTNDTVAGGYAELYLGQGKNAQNVFYTNIGSGIGGGLFLGRKYYDGIGRGASYLGNSYIPDWTVSQPGKACIVEKICSGPGITARLQQPDYVPQDSLLWELANGKRENILPITLEKAGHAGDSFALAEIDRIAESYSIGLCNLLSLVSPQMIVVGGGVGKMGDLLLNPVRKHVANRAFVAARGQYTILQSKLLDDAVIAGAVLCAVHAHM